MLLRQAFNNGSDLFILCLKSIIIIVLEVYSLADLCSPQSVLSNELFRFQMYNLVVVVAKFDFTDFMLSYFLWSIT